MLSLFLSCLKMAGTSHVFTCQNLSVPVPVALGFTFLSDRRSQGEMLLEEGAAMVQ